ncbi:MULTISPECIES: LacI family DNA-binding transcriptional regulator [unclassified Brenneria]|uniref:LacI family DNA-binding transcriptional regulator n=1 Tax=unclassified Brenneria TaxID=2634434 RepID=UPI0029C56AD7|nr:MULTISPECIES: LacI family DNA-binding transcriptional regulator [unclassified Brenneria]MDX5626986.1 LacI family DNA-binding transcriptional regulator [Brenneria sp. L3-3Z]MDX5693664.1 LacI family DNA-binding transcriptional regulator [Brenneria sp. L4-2C]MEE3661695.1 LacI family DNA-binding transcriptional regulator [Brenneria sp. g21c3]
MSLKKIASELGISSTTVSRALNGYDDVAPATRERIVEAAKRLGYQPNLTARRLKMGKTDAVALAYPSRPRVLNNSTFLEMIGWISIELAKFGIDLLLIPDEPNETHQSLTRLVQTRRVDALLVAHTRPDDHRLKYLQAQNFPFLALGRSNLSQPYAWFDFDNYAGSVMAVERLVELGHQRIAFLSTNAQLAYVEQRLQGYSDTLARCLLPQPENYIQKAEPNRPGGYYATQRLLALDEPPTAIITDCNMLGEGAASALQQVGRLGKQGVSLIVYDGLPDDNLIDVAITPIIQNTRTNVGKQIAAMIRRLLDGADPQQVQVLWQPELGRGDTDCPPV